MPHEGVALALSLSSIVLLVAEESLRLVTDLSGQLYPLLFIEISRFLRVVFMP